MTPQMNLNIAKPVLIGTKTFTTGLVSEGSWGASALGTHESHMELYRFDGDDERGYIEWDIPAIEQCEEIGLVYDVRPDGRLELAEYDGVMSLPKEAIALLEEAGIVVGEDFR